MDLNLSGPFQCQRERAGAPHQAVPPSAVPNMPCMNRHLKPGTPQPAPHTRLPTPGSPYQAPTCLPNRKDCGAVVIHTRRPTPGAPHLAPTCLPKRKGCEAVAIHTRRPTPGTPRQAPTCLPKRKNGDAVAIQRALHQLLHPARAKQLLLLCAARQASIKPGHMGVKRVGGDAPGSRRLHKYFCCGPGVEHPKAHFKGRAPDSVAGTRKGGGGITRVAVPCPMQQSSVQRSVTVPTRNTRKENLGFALCPSMLRGASSAARTHLNDLAPARVVPGSNSFPLSRHGSATCQSEATKQRVWGRAGGRASKSGVGKAADLQQTLRRRLGCTTERVAP
eukprot:354157-Chlamydomonas_euryale.AAC.12